MKKGVALASSLALLLALGACGKRVDTAERDATTPNTETSQTASTGPSTSSSSSTDTTASSSATSPSTDTTASASSTAPSTNEMGAGSSTGMLDDAQIVTKVNAALAADSDLSALKINVDSKNGMVTLKGSAPDAAAKDRAEQLVKNVKDVKSVDNQLTLG